MKILVVTNHVTAPTICAQRALRQEPEGPKQQEQTTAPALPNLDNLITLKDDSTAATGMVSSMFSYFFAHRNSVPDVGTPCKEVPDTVTPTIPVAASTDQIPSSDNQLPTPATTLEPTNTQPEGRGELVDENGLPLLPRKYPVL